MEKTNTNIKAVVLAGQRDFGRCPIASRLPRAFWPLAGETILERLLKNLHSQGINRALICLNQNGPPLEPRLNIPGMQIELRHEQLPQGTGGCLREAARNDPESLWLAIQGNLIFPPDLSPLIAEHLRSGALLTVALHRPDADSGLEAAGIYLAQPEITRFLPAKGYADIKEGLIPRILRDGLPVHVFRLEQPTGNFHDWAEYLKFSLDYVQAISKKATEPALITASARIHPTARLSGPVMVEAGAQIAAGAEITGPALIGPGVKIAGGARIAYSILWSSARIGKHAQLRGCLVDEKITVPVHAQAEASLFPLAHARAVPAVSGFTAELPLALKLRSAAAGPGRALRDCLNAWAGHPAWSRPRWQLAAWACLLVAFAASYWPTLAELWDIWMKNDEFSSGLLVPPMTAWLIWVRRRQIFQQPAAPQPAGLLLFFAAQALRIAGLLLMFDSAIRLSLVLSLAGLAWYLFGGRIFRQLLPLAAFLLLMLPFPKRIQQEITAPLQTWATTSAVYLLEMIGYRVYREGNLIHLQNVTVAIAEACNGLRMVTAFFVIIGLIVLLIRRSWWEKLALILSALPIALICNTLRLAFTAMIFARIRNPEWDQVFHDYGGYAMMPLAVGLIILELWVMDRLFLVPRAPSGPNILVPRRSAGAAARSGPLPERLPYN